MCIRDRASTVQSASSPTRKPRARGSGVLPEAAAESTKASSPARPHCAILRPEFLLNLLFYIIITPVISLTLTRIMYMSENKMVVADALARIDSVLEAAFLPKRLEPSRRMVAVSK